jgi:TolB-like protein/DNA-binding winged helix-turn-helix (wHTH) protein/Flp pilus assembly protein TadD
MAAMNDALENMPDGLRIGEWRFYVSARELEGDGRKVRLEPRAAQLLLFLAAHAGETVSRATLLDRLWPDMVVTDEALTNAVNKLRRAFGDDRAKPRLIETIPKTGYRLIAPVQPLVPAAHSAATDNQEIPYQHAGRRNWSYRLLQIAGSLLVLAMAVIVWLVATESHTGNDQQSDNPRMRQETSVSHRPALAVLPFDNLADEPDQEYFAEGITDDVITRLAKYPGLMVIARDSSFFYKGREADLRAIAEKLNVDYLVRGSIRREGTAVKLNAWLVDVATDSHVWAEHFERNAGQIFEIQKDIARGIAAALTSRADTGPDTTQTTANQEAYDKLLLGRQHFYRFESRAENLKARSYFEEAVRLDPEFATAWAMLAWSYAFDAMNGWTDDRQAALQQAERLATRAIQIQPQLSVGYYVRGLSFREQQEYIKALVEAQKAIKYDPNNANGHVLLATLLYYAGRPQEGLANILKAMQINPHHPYNYHFHLGQAYFVLHRYREAIDALNEGLSSNPASERMRVWLVAALAHAGDTETARWEAEQVMAVDADFSVQRMARAFPFKNPVDIEHFVEGLRLAGLH